MAFNKTFINSWSTGAVIVMGLFLASCETQRKVASNPLEVAAKSKPVRNISNFDASLACMDRLIPSYVNEPVIVMAETIQNESGIKKGLPESANNMLISALSKISRTNKLIRYVSINAKQNNLEAAFRLRSKELAGKQKNKSEMMYAPRYFITGAITQVSQDASRSSKDVGVGASFKQFEGFAGTSNQNSMSTIALDLNMGSVYNKQILPGVTSNNIMPVYKKSDGTDLMIGFVGLGNIDFSMEFRSNEGIGSALRALVDLAAIELMGKFLNMPYENCLMNADSIETALQENKTGALLKRPRSLPQVGRSGNVGGGFASRRYGDDRVDLEEVKRRAAKQEHERTLWQTARKLGSVEAYQAYLDEFPYGEYADSVRRERKKALQKATTARLQQPVRPAAPLVSPKRGYLEGGGLRKYEVTRGVTVRSIPRLSGKDVGRLEAGSTIKAKVVPAKGNWRKITMESGNIGYVFGKPFRRLY